MVAVPVARGRAVHGACGPVGLRSVPGLVFLWLRIGRLPRPVCGEEAAFGTDQPHPGRADHGQGGRIC